MLHNKKKNLKSPISFHSSLSFWKSNVNDYPKLSKLALILLNVPASSANIERFFSVAGVVCNQRAGNSLNDLIIQRSLLKTNLLIL